MPPGRGLLFPISQLRCWARVSAKWDIFLEKKSIVCPVIWK